MAFSHWDAALTLDSNARALTLLLLTVPAGGFNFEKKEPIYREKSFLLKKSSGERLQTRLLVIYDRYKESTIRYSLRSWRYCVGARLKFWRRSRDRKRE